ncbi:uncharacterized protein si:ch211-217g15.3 [Notolabrus celidotus]|uniref:uncharacterized protein si:ch211-217g15.3 n=1 Tax=Notolabrus celidotus TaxID=1203425 RepID=UPI0014900C8F|nr:uncharacterized protein si:ch211-217g15.3 [Notolabrus celidotus]
MLRFSLTIAVTLIISVTAKPHKPLNTFKDEAFQDTVMSIGKDGKMSWGVEVEPPEDLDETLYDVDPSMKIWKSMMGGREDKHHMKAEVDLDELHHPSIAERIRAKLQSIAEHRKADSRAEFVEVEEDKDNVDHPDFEVVPEDPEQDWDAVYNTAQEKLSGYLAPLVAKYQTGAEVRPLYSEPEEDMDDLYHKDFLEPALHQDDAQPAEALVDLPSQRKHSEPEEDLDDIYHK